MNFTKSNLTTLTMLAATVIIASAAVFGQQVGAGTEPKSDENVSRLSKTTFSRPAELPSLTQYVKQHFAGRVDPDSIRPTSTDGKAAVTFTITEGERTTDSILIDNGDSLELHNDNYPTWWKYAPNVTSDESYDVDTSFLTERKEANEVEAAAFAATPTCAGIASPGNPYPCCSVGSSTNLGNCTFYAWHAAKSFWGYSMPTWGGNGASNAANWYDKSRASGLPTSATPGLYAIAVSSTMAAPYGHVAWVMEIANNQLYVWEQLCGSTATGVVKTWRSTTSFNKGYVMSPVSAPSPTIALATVGSIFKSTSTQAIQFRVTNVNAGKRAVVIFPDGGRATLKDGQLSSVSGGIMTAYMTLNARGTWKIQMFNENGKYSGLASFTVN